MNFLLSPACGRGGLLSCVKLCVQVASQLIEAATTKHHVKSIACRKAVIRQCEDASADDCVLVSGAQQFGHLFHLAHLRRYVGHFAAPVLMFDGSIIGAPRRFVNTKSKKK